MVRCLSCPYDVAKGGKWDVHFSYKFVLTDNLKLLQDVDNKLQKEYNDKSWMKFPLIIEGPWVFGWMDETHTFVLTELEARHSSFPQYFPWSFNWPEEATDNSDEEPTQSSLLTKRGHISMALGGKGRGSKRPKSSVFPMPAFVLPTFRVVQPSGSTAPKRKSSFKKKAPKLVSEVASTSKIIAAPRVIVIVEDSPPKAPEDSTSHEYIPIGGGGSVIHDVVVDVSPRSAPAKPASIAKPLAPPVLHDYAPSTSVGGSLPSFFDGSPKIEGIFSRLAEVGFPHLSSGVCASLANFSSRGFYGTPNLHEASQSLSWPQQMALMTLDRNRQLSINVAAHKYAAELELLKVK